MNDIDPQQFGQLQAHVGTLIKSVERLDEKITRLETSMSEARGGWRLLMALASVSASVGGFLAWALTHLTGKGPS